MRKNITTRGGDVKELTRAEMASMRPLREVDPKLLVRLQQASNKLKRGRPQGRSKAVVSISVDKDILEALRASGAGWQSRVNTLLRAAMGLQA
ncbi:MAG: BrnA antitoxin family protein [Alphaproteobacteria bacterium]|nr:BrnA antitoxin family protein [Alphaproteobacteria bacterium]